MNRPSRSTLALSLVALFLAACAAAPSNEGKVVPPTAFKVHPGLLGQPVPPELQPAGAGDVATVVAGNAQGGTMRMDGEGLRTQRSVYFDFNQHDIKADFQPALAAHGRYLAEHPKARIRVEGNADERGSAHYNKVLGMRRAHSVKNALLANGAKDAQVRTITLGDTRPKLKGKDEASWAENRRADVVYEVEK